MALGLAVVLSSPGRPEALEKVIITQAVESLAFVANYVARANGYFIDENLAVEVISTRGGGPDIKANLAGRVEFSIAAGTYQINAVKAGGRLTLPSARTSPSGSASPRIRPLWKSSKN
jgi:ABC-type nitrate/sulfonate/bicarbonate transport system substrate-binding protein